jgi:hypothetical protein
MLLKFICVDCTTIAKRCASSVLFLLLRTKYCLVDHENVLVDAQMTSYNQYHLITCVFLKIT